MVRQGREVEKCNTKTLLQKMEKKRSSDPKKLMVAY
jgi:hypothetical protein